MHAPKPAPVIVLEADLGALAIQQYPDPSGRLRAWAQGFVRNSPTDTLALVKDLSAGVPGWISYQSREGEGTQSPTGAPAGILRFSLSRQRAAWVSGRGSSPAISTTRTRIG